MTEEEPDEESFVKTDAQKKSKEHEDSESTVRMKLFSALYYSCIQISNDIAKEVTNENGKSIEFDGSVIAQTTRLLLDALTNTWPVDLLKFAKHGRRSNVNITDFLLLFRKNQSLTEFISGFNEEQYGKRPKQVKDSANFCKANKDSATNLLDTGQFNGSIVDTKRKTKSEESSLKLGDNGLISIKKFLNRPSKIRKVTSHADAVDANGISMPKKRKSAVRGHKQKDDDGVQIIGGTKVACESVQHNTSIKKQSGQQAFEDVLSPCTSMTKRHCMKNSVSFDVDEDSRDSFDGVDWDAIDRVDNNKVCNQTNAVKEEERCNVPKVSTPLHFSKEKVKQETVNTRDDSNRFSSYVKQDGRLSSFTAFHFESDDDEDDDGGLANAGSFSKSDEVALQLSAVNLNFQSTKFRECDPSVVNPANITGNLPLHTNQVASEPNSIFHSDEDLGMDATVFD